MEDQQAAYSKNDTWDITHVRQPLVANHFLSKKTAPTNADAVEVSRHKQYTSSDLRSLFLELATPQYSNRSGSASGQYDTYQAKFLAMGSSKINFTQKAQRQVSHAPLHCPFSQIP